MRGRGSEGSAAGKAAAAPAAAGGAEGSRPAASPAPPAPAGDRSRFTLDAEGRFVVPAGSFGPGEEGDYTVLLDGSPLKGDLTADGKPVTVRVVGPQAVSLEKNPVTVAPEGGIRLALRGEDLPAGVPLALLEEGKEEPAFRIRPAASGGGYEGAARAGKFLLAWDTPRGAEAIPGLALEVYPSPTVTAVTPARVQPQVQVELAFEGLNLAEAGELLLVPATGTPGERDGSLHLSIDRARLVQEGPRSRYRTEPISLKTGKYTVLPGGKAAVEVIEDCTRLLDAYRRDPVERDKLIDCLKEGSTAPGVRREAADLFFDQGLFTESLEIYRSLDDLKSRFRTAFMARYLEQPHAPGFQRKEDDPRVDPYLAWAAVLGWLGKESSKDAKMPPEDPGAPWEMDFLRGTLTEDPQGAIGSFTAAIDKKRAAAGPREVAPFAPAIRGRAGAQLRLGLALLKAGKGSEARDSLQKSFFENPDRYAQLAEEDRTRASFFFGHALLWYSGDEESAVRYFKHAVETAPATEYGGFCSLYLESLGAAGADPSATASAPREGSWEASFLAALKGCRTVRRTPSYNILTESYDFGSLLYPEERKASLELHRAVKALESQEDPPDPLAQGSLLYYLRSAQSASWPGQEGGTKAKDHRDKLAALKLEGESALLRDFYILEAEVEPLESAQMTLLPPAEVQKQARKALALQRGSLSPGMKERVKRLQRKLQTS